MPDNYALKFTPIANDDVDQIYQYIVERLYAPKAAHDLMEDIENSILRLKDFPYSGSPVADDILRGRGYRKLLIKNYIVFYLIDEAEKQVVIMRVFYGARQYDKLL